MVSSPTIMQELLRVLAHVQVQVKPLVTEKNRRICKAHLGYPCDFMTEYQDRTDPAMKIDMHISLRASSMAINTSISEG